jgi:hypothetical protein
MIVTQTASRNIQLLVRWYFLEHCIMTVVRNLYFVSAAFCLEPDHEETQIFSHLNNYVQTFDRVIL